MRNPYVKNQQDAERLSDPEYLAYCQNESRKLFEAMVAKRWPNLVFRDDNKNTGTQYRLS